MPEPTGSGTPHEPQTPPAGGQGGGSGEPNPQGGAAGESAQDKKLAAEAAKYRVQLRTVEKERDEMKTRIEELEQKVNASPGGDQNAELAKVRRELGDLQKTVKEATERERKAVEASKAEKLDNALRKAAAEANVIDTEDAVIVLKAKGRARIADDGKPVFVVVENGEEREIEISSGSIKDQKLLKENFFKADGVGGAGSRGGSRGAGPSGLDYERGLRDPAYFKAHEKEMEQEARRRNSA
jgi:hypothetical protein